MAQWFLTRNQNRYGPYTDEQMRQMVAVRQVLPSDLIWSEGMTGWKPAGQVPAVFPPPDAAIPTVLPAESAVVAAPAARAAAKPATPTPRPGPVNEPNASSETGEYDPGQFQRCRAGLTQAGLDLTQLLYFCATRTVKTADLGQAVFGVLHDADSFRPIYHLSLFRRELAAVALDEKGDVIADRAPHDLLDWTFANATEGGGEVLTLRFPAGELALRLSDSPGLTRFKELLAGAIEALAREHLDAGRRPQAEGLLERLGRLPSGREAAAELRKQFDPAPTPDSPRYKPRVVGCPRCNSKLRANRPGILQCPKCQAKVRAAEGMFQTTAG